MIRNSVFRLLVLLFFFCFSPLVSTLSSAKTNDRAVQQVTELFKGKTFAELNGYFAINRDGRLAPIIKRLALEDCYARLRIVDDQVKLSRLKIKLRPVFNLFRAGETELLLFDDAEPNAFHLPGVAIGLSTGLCALVRNDNELIGIVAHELAHKFFIKTASDEDSMENVSQQQRIEIMCDGVAVAAMIELKLNPAKYRNIIRRILTHSTMTSRMNNGDGSHPSLNARLEIIKQLSGDRRKDR